MIVSYELLKLSWDFLNNNGVAIEAIAIVILTIVTAIYVVLTHRLVKIEQDREKGKREKFLDVLLAEFLENGSLMDHYEEELKRQKQSSWIDLSIMLFGFRDDGFNAFRNQGGFQYLEDCPLYEDIARYYVNQYKLHTKINNLIAVGKDKERDNNVYKSFTKRPEDFMDEIKKAIKKLKEENIKLQKKILQCKKH